MGLSSPNQDLHHAAVQPPRCRLGLETTSVERFRQSRAWTSLPCAGSKSRKSPSVREGFRPVSRLGSRGLGPCEYACFSSQPTGSCWLMRSPRPRFTFMRPSSAPGIVGWYNNATIHRRWQSPPPQANRRYEGNEFGYYVTAASSDA